MSEHLDKAKGALAEAAKLGPDDVTYHDLLKIASVQAAVAQADALERIAGKLDTWSGGPGGISLRVLS